MNYDSQTCLQTLVSEKDVLKAKFIDSLNSNTGLCGIAFLVFFKLRKLTRWIGIIKMGEVREVC